MAVRFKISPGGEILVKGKTLFKGYLQRQKVHLPVDSEGWFATHDLGTLDQDSCLTVLGRKDNLFISGGENIQPEEIEKKLYELEVVVQAVVVERPDVEFGCRPVAFLKLKNKKTTDAAQIISHLKQHLPKFKIPQTFYHWPENFSQGNGEKPKKPSSEWKENRTYFRDLIKNEEGSLKKLS